MTRSKLMRLVPVVAVVVLAAGISANIAGGQATSDNYVSDVVYIADESSADATDSKKVTTMCPDSRHVIGGGADIDFTGSGGSNETENVTLRTSQPSPNSEGSPADGHGTGWTAIAQETDQTTDSWDLDSWAICAKTDSPAPEDASSSGASSSGATSSGATSSGATSSGATSSGATSSGATSSGTSSSGTSSSTSSSGTSSSGSSGS